MTLSPSQAESLPWSSSTSSSSSFSPFSSKTFFLPSTDARDSQGNRHLSCALGIAPPYPGHGGRPLPVTGKKGSIPRSLSNPLPSLLSSLSPREPSASASALFLSRFVCGTPSQPSWREWRKTHPLTPSSPGADGRNKGTSSTASKATSAAKTGEEEGGKKEKQKSQGGADASRREMDRQPREDPSSFSGASPGRGHIAEVVAFLESANEASDDDDLFLDPRLYIAVLIASSKQNTVTLPPLPCTKKTVGICMHVRQAVVAAVLRLTKWFGDVYRRPPRLDLPVIGGGHSVASRDTTCAFRRRHPCGLFTSSRLTESTTAVRYGTRDG